MLRTALIFSDLPCYADGFYIPFKGVFSADLFFHLLCELWEGGGELFINLGILFLITNKPGKFSFQTSYLHFLALLYVYVIH